MASSNSTSRESIVFHFLCVFDKSAFREDGLERSVNYCLEKLRGKKKIDLFEIARVHRGECPVEDQWRQLARIAEEGRFDYIGLSECSAESLRQAHAVSSLRSGDNCSQSDYSNL